MILYRVIAILCVYCLTNFICLLLYVIIKKKVCQTVYIYSKTPIYRCVWGQGNIRGKSGSAVNRGFVWFTLCMFSPIWGKDNGRGISGFAVNRGAVNRGFTVQSINSSVVIGRAQYRGNGNCLLLPILCNMKYQQSNINTSAPS